MTISPDLEVGNGCFRNLTQETPNLAPSPVAGKELGAKQRIATIAASQMAA